MSVVVLSCLSDPFSNQCALQL